MKVYFSYVVLMAVLAAKPVSGADSRFCKAYNENYFANYDTAPEYDSTFDTTRQVELMATVSRMENVASLISVFPYVGDFAEVAAAALGLYEDSISSDVVKLLKTYVDKVNKENKIEDIQTDWAISAGVVSGALLGNDVASYNLGAAECEKFFGPSTGGTIWDGSLSYGGNDYSEFGSTERLAYAPAMCNACSTIHAWRYWKYGEDYDELSEVGRATAAASKESRDGALEDLRYTLGRCYFDVLPMTWNATWGEHVNAVGAYQEKWIKVNFVHRSYGTLAYDGARFYEYDYCDFCAGDTGDSDDPGEDYYKNCAADMKKNVADFWMKWYRGHIFGFQRGWGKLLAAASPNGLVLRSAPKVNDGRSYVIMNEAYGAFLSLGGALQDADYTTSTYYERSQGAFVKNDNSLSVVIVPFSIESEGFEGFAIQDTETGYFLGVEPSGQVQWHDNLDYDLDQLDPWNWLTLEQADPDNDPTAFYIKAPEIGGGTYLTAGNSFLPVYSEAVDVQGTNSPDDFAVWRIFQAPDFEANNYASFFECSLTDECESGEICDPVLFYCRDDPAKERGEQCESDDECASGFCQVCFFFA